jgi:hypothetical protein
MLFHTQMTNDGIEVIGADWKLKLQAAHELRHNPIVDQASSLTLHAAVISNSTVDVKLAPNYCSHVLSF